MYVCYSLDQLQCIRCIYKYIYISVYIKYVYQKWLSFRQTLKDINIFKSTCFVYASNFRAFALLL